MRLPLLPLAAVAGLALAGTLARPERGSAARAERFGPGGDGQLWREVGVNLDPDEEDHEVVTDDHGRVVAASRFGWKEGWDGEGLASFSIGVRPAARRRGLARRLVTRILRAHPGASFRVWVVNPHMAELLTSLGFDAEGTRGWSPDSPHMTFRVPTRAQTRARRAAEADRAARAAKAQAERPRAQAEEAAQLAERVRQVAQKAPGALETLDFLYVDPARFVDDPRFTREVYRLWRAGRWKSPIPGIPDLYLPLNPEGEFDPKKLARARERYAMTLQSARRTRGSAARWGDEDKRLDKQIAQIARDQLRNKGVAVPAPTDELGQGVDARVFNTTRKGVVVRVGRERSESRERLLLDEDYAEGVVPVLALETALGHVVSWKERVDTDVEGFLLRRYPDQDIQSLLRALVGLYHASNGNLAVLSRYPETKGLARAIRRGMPTNDIDLNTNLGVTQSGKVVAYDL